MTAVHRVTQASASASKRFLRSMVWVCIICGLLLGGQGLRYYFNYEQLAEIRSETVALYKSVMGNDIGGSPFGRLQFEHGKLTATHRIGLDPIGVLAALSRPAVESLRVEGMTLDGLKGHIHGFFGPNVQHFDQYIKELGDDEQYFFTLEKKEEVFGGVNFSLIVEPQ